MQFHLLIVCIHRAPWSAVGFCRFLFGVPPPSPHNTATFQCLDGASHNSGALAFTVVLHHIAAQRTQALRNTLLIQ